MCGNGAVGAVAWRGVLTRFRTPRTALETFTGAGVGLAIVLVPVLTGRQAGAGAVLVGGAVQLAVLFMAGNSFGSDGPAMSGELLTGVDPAVLVQAKARSVVVSAAPVAVVGPVIAAAFTGEWNYLPAGFIVGVGGLFAGAGAAMVQSSFVPIAIPESDNPLASGDSGKGWFAGLVLAAVLFALAILTLPVALALLWAVDRQSLTLVIGVRRRRARRRGARGARRHRHRRRTMARSWPRVVRPDRPGALRSIRVRRGSRLRPRLVFGVHG